MSLGKTLTASFLVHPGMIFIIIIDLIYWFEKFKSEQNSFSRKITSKASRRCRAIQYHLNLCRCPCQNRTRRKEEESTLYYK